MPTVELPPYMRKTNAESVREECAPYRTMSFEDRARELGLLCRGIPAILARYSDEHWAKLQALDARLPDSTRAALARLRLQYRERPR